MARKTNPRVLMIGPDLQSRGGMATVERQLMERLPSAGIQARFIPTYDDCSKAKKASIAFVAYASFCRALKDTDIVHVHMASRGSYERKSLFLRKAISKGKKTVVHLHGGEFGIWFDDELGDKKRDEIRALFSSVDAVIVLSEEWEEWLTSRRFSPKRLVVMHNAVPVPERPCSPCSHQEKCLIGIRPPNCSLAETVTRSATRFLPVGSVSSTAVSSWVGLPAMIKRDFLSAQESTACHPKTRACL